MKTRRQHHMVIGLFILFVTGSMIVSLAGCGHREEETAAPQEAAVKIPNANEKYPNANDEMVYFVDGEGKVEQWTLDGVYRHSYSLGKEELDQSDLLYVDNNEILWLDWSDSLYTAVMRTPIQKTKAGETLKTDAAEKLFSMKDMDCYSGGGSGGVLGKSGTVVANAEYVAFISYDEFLVYDRKKGEKIFSKKDSLFTSYALSAISEVCGDQIIFNSSMHSRHPSETNYEFSIYRLGDQQVRTIDSRCSSEAAYIADPARNKVYYQIYEDQSIWEYDCQTEQKREAISEEQLRACYQTYGLVWDEAYMDDCLFVDGNRLYFVKDQKNPLIFSCDLTKSSLPLRYEMELTELVRSQTKYTDSDADEQRLAILEGKLLLYWCDDDVEEYYVCIDIKTKTGKLVGKSGWLFQVQDPDMVYFALFGAWEDPGTTGKLRKFSYDEKQTADTLPKTAQRLSYEEQLTLLCSQADQWLKKDEFAYYAVTDLDQNGKLELIASTGMQGSGGDTSSVYFQVAADGVSLRKCKSDWESEGYSEPDIVEGLQTAYVDPDTGTYYYITSDYISGGAGARYRWNGAIVLKNGRFTTRTFASMEETTWSEKKKELKYRYYKEVNGHMRKISKKEYKPEKLAQEYFAGFEKKKVNISWIGFQKKRKKISDQDIFKKLSKSYEAFAITAE